MIKNAIDKKVKCAIGLVLSFAMISHPQLSATETDIFSEENELQLDSESINEELCEIEVTEEDVVEALPVVPCYEENNHQRDLLEEIQFHRDNQEVLSQLLPIVRCCFHPTKYESILMTQLRDSTTEPKLFREISDKIGQLLVNKVVECLPIRSVEIETPVTESKGIVLANRVELVSIMRSGDALLDTFLKHFADAHVSKILIQRDEETAEPHFKYMKLSPTIASGRAVIITEPMIATGGSLDTAITLLKSQGVEEENIIVASICAAPEGLARLSAKYPQIQVVMTVMDEKLNEKKYIVPGLGDFGDRYFGTVNTK